MDGQVHYLFGIRGSLPVVALVGKPEEGYEFSSSHELSATPINYSSPCCTIGIWNEQTNKLAVYPGSSLPSTEYLTRMPQKRAEFNILCPGNYTLSKGLHPRNSDFIQYPAFLMNGQALVYKPKLVRVTSGLDFSFEDANHQVVFAGDNLHATGYEPGVKENEMSLLNLPVDSSGCITVCGCPKLYQRNQYSSSHWNSWEYFYNFLDKQKSRDYSFMLFNYEDFTYSKQPKGSIELRYGSEGESVQELQTILSQSLDARTGKPYYKGEIDGKLVNESASSAFEFFQNICSPKIGSTIPLEKIKTKIKHFGIT
ncbi:hypothetical protein LZ575_01275 [Antarcticibacterium sp. 1MA-6-2]|uniref:hypothetical protein n=1 Tax=Antarcticibacterium sp. 1MA-6-2 TaxID=2908210 RepID=UPI001F1816A7|nr:hypothetical protein [Antarcticibacterium sp. 1MA-6-2]UJH91446.1 hypothetical protein LZ575_01275 [Antarcticibacterium sp. 1MA-6-2]